MIPILVEHRICELEQRRMCLADIAYTLSFEFELADLEDIAHDWFGECLVDEWDFHNPSPFVLCKQFLSLRKELGPALRH